MLTSHSEYGTLKKVFIKRALAAFKSQDEIDSQWKKLNYLSSPNYDRALFEYKGFEKLIEQSGSEVSYFNSNPDVSIDSLYCRDASIMTDHGVILCSMGKEERISEPKACKEDYELKGIKILGEISGDGKVEGGDVAWLDEKTLAVAHGYRTNDEGYAQLCAFLNPNGIEVIQVDLPHYKGQNDVFHLMSIFSPVDKNKAVVYSPLMPVRFREELLSRDYDLIEVPENEFESMGCNVLAVSPSNCLLVKGNNITATRLKSAGCTVSEYEGQEISVKGGGGPTCLSRPILREI